MEVYLKKLEVKVEIIEQEAVTGDDPVKYDGVIHGVKRHEDSRDRIKSGSVQELVEYYNGMTFDPSSPQYLLNSKAGTPLSLLQFISADDLTLQKENAESEEEEACCRRPPSSLVDNENILHEKEEENEDDHVVEEKEMKMKKGKEKVEDEKTLSEWDIYGRIEVGQEATDLLDLKSPTNPLLLNRQEPSSWYYKISDNGRNLPILKSKLTEEAIQKLNLRFNDNELKTAAEEEENYFKQLTILHG